MIILPILTTSFLHFRSANQQEKWRLLMEEKKYIKLENPNFNIFWILTNCFIFYATGRKNCFTSGRKITFVYIENIC